MTNHIDNNFGFPCMVPNTVIEAENGDFYVSYNDYDISIYGTDTTALVKGQMEKFYILNGDHRKQYSVLIPKGFNACLDYFKKNIKFINKNSDKL